MPFGSGDGLAGLKQGGRLENGQHSPRKAAPYDYGAPENAGLFALFGSCCSAGASFVHLPFILKSAFVVST